MEFCDVEQIIGETIPAMRKLQQQGKTRYVGITGYSLRNLVEIASRAEVDSILTYCRYNLLISGMNDVLMPFAEEHGTGIINASVLHMGVLTHGGAPSWHPAPPEVHKTGKKIVEYCTAQDADVSEVALKFCFDHDGVASTLVGMSTRAHVDANPRALNCDVNPDLPAKIRHIAGPIYNRTWPSGLEKNFG